MGWFTALMVANAVVRGMGAGIIYDAAVVSPPLRKRIGAPAYAQYLRANLSGLGGKSYVIVAWSGLLSTLTAAIAAFLTAEPSAVRWWITAALAATVVAFLGTGMALPALFRVVRHSGDVNQLPPLLNRYASWYAFSAAWQAIAFTASVFAIALH